MDAIFEFLALFQWKVIVMTMLRMGLVIGLALIGIAVAKRFINRLERHLVERSQARGEAVEEFEKRTYTIARLLRQGVVILIWVMVALVILRDVGVEIGPLLASAGIVGLAVGFGAQNLVRDVISGFFLIIEDQIRVGDIAIINGTGGLVESINFRTTVLRDLSGVVHIFPNGTITTLSNMTHEWSAHIFDIGVAYKEDVDRVIELLKAIGTTLREDDYFGPLIIEDIEVFGLDQFADSALVIKGRIKTRPIKQWEVGREFKRRVKQTFDKEGIEIPFPHRSIYFGEASKPFVTRMEAETAALSKE
ncbi:mechanosensitive ion channel family protein [Thiohalomonas denitrificans]|uniref:Small conductance mechanosensitive channel n=1 Tax=Thiohalomonas denitrificans TaxID=415747 RepID=A0A1G5QAZ0_9GAMM|nr:mechanosensitive ion channel family protein [Thiohalomonas denitrificans]SCZ58994.1 small conductance mechanosensitive channel [Thiohalomonas denitrificans]